MISSQTKWFKQNEHNFSKDLNGYSSPPLGPYSTTLPLIDRDGRILDLGMGNGMLLKYIMTFSGHKIEPYGVDIHSIAFNHAIEKILPEYKNNLFFENVNNYNFSQGPFDIIITNPFYGKPNVKQYIDKCLQNLSPKGRLILRMHHDILRHLKIESIRELDIFSDYPIKISQGIGLEFGVIDLPI